MAVSVLKVFKVPDVGADRFKAFVSDLESVSLTPRRNCDVGTPEEQLKRKRVYCKAQDCGTCPFYGNDSLLCAFRWAQAPHKEGGAK